MNKQDLTILLKEIAGNDITSDSDIHDHPCSVAIRALDECFNDIDTLCGVIRQDARGHSKKVRMLIGLSYNPDW